MKIEHLQNGQNTPTKTFATQTREDLSLTSNECVIDQNIYFLLINVTVEKRSTRLLSNK